MINQSNLAKLNHLHYQQFKTESRLAAAAASAHPKDNTIRAQHQYQQIDAMMESTRMQALNWRPT